MVSAAPGRHGPAARHDASRPEFMPPASPLPKSFFWHDYETFGVEPWRDRPAQFAGIRTDAELNETAEPVVAYCQLSSDLLPQPDSCLITGITPQVAQEKGVPEYEFAKRVNAWLSAPGSCAVGYNSLRFDAEFTRHLLYRNFHEPYAHEWSGGNSRWDLLDVCRMACALRPAGLNWPGRDGGVAFSLSALSEANGIALESAHDALADTRATLELARRLRAAQPRLFDYALRLRDKRFARRQLGDGQPVVHVSGRLRRANGYASMVAWVAETPGRPNSQIVVDLGVDPEPLLEFDADALRGLLFTARDARAPDAPEIGLKRVFLNRSPMLSPAATLDSAAAERLGIDSAAAVRRWRRLSPHRDALAAKALEIYADDAAPRERDVDGRLYDGFFGDADRRQLRRLTELRPERLRAERFRWQDGRVPELLLRYRARHAIDTLDPAELERWRADRERRLADESAGYMTVERYSDIVAGLRDTAACADARSQRLLDALEDYVDHVVSVQ